MGNKLFDNFSHLLLDKMLSHWNKVSKGRRPWKIWDATRAIKRLVLATSLEELLEKGWSCMLYCYWVMLKLE